MWKFWQDIITYILWFISTWWCLLRWSSICNMSLFYHDICFLWSYLLLNIWHYKKKILIIKSISICFLFSESSHKTLIVFVKGKGSEQGAPFYEEGSPWSAGERRDKWLAVVSLLQQTPWRLSSLLIGSSDRPPDQHLHQSHHLQAVPLTGTK